MCSEQQDHKYQAGDRVKVTDPGRLSTGAIGTVTMNIGREAAEANGKTGDALFVTLDDSSKGIGGLAAVTSTQVEPITDEAPAQPVAA